MKDNQFACGAHDIGRIRNEYIDTCSSCEYNRGEYYGAQQERERLRAEVEQDKPHFDPEIIYYARQLLADPT